MGKCELAHNANRADATHQGGLDDLGCLLFFAGLEGSNGLGSGVSALDALWERLGALLAKLQQLLQSGLFYIGIFVSRGHLKPSDIIKKKDPRTLTQARVFWAKRESAKPLW